MPRRRRCATIAEAAARIEALEVAVEALTTQVLALAQAQNDARVTVESLALRVRVLEATQTFMVAG